ncbi:M4 family peptidase [Rathayibacter tritici]|uniref:Neutral metalloproteinase n=1 Tax=Rathayibacter tritici TaxID=33888 RepID=A0A160KS06_9MICO|nr:M4 family metallopeptidase [Rathayibacter tritici]AND16119.1 peptidase M4 [Rathayibacter tritici]PPF23213.1 M4 family peptidase [Rathayibacter tritici]PPF66834.1 M4 family peptidase [Rathayibacter tritici]PPG06897.1 M4 family peptidase [Rathayibacter tritici]PPI12395.1 M4 family peptidase [Rathayibacter tritici]
MKCAAVPPYLLVRISQLEDPAFARAAQAASRSLQQDLPFRRDRPDEPGHRAPTASATRSTRTSPQALQRTISDAKNTQTLPGTVIRREGEPPLGDTAADEAYDSLGAMSTFLQKAYGRASIDDAWLPLDATVHYGHEYDNAFWDGSRMVFGDGDGQVFRRFTVSPSVIGHELTHGITASTANLVYRGQSGALNESISDVFGTLLEQFGADQSARDASWLIGEGLFTDDVQGTAMRSMLAPGTAYDDDVLGSDPQPGSMAHYVETDEDNGGVHINSGIPNRAFAVAATTLGGRAWERMGQVWYDVLTGGVLTATADFAAFAALTVTAASARYGADSDVEDAVRRGWTTVGVALPE